jgi:arginine decarboxylase
VGHDVFIVIEQLSEVDVLLEVADEMGVTPKLGVRIKLATESAGRWAQSAGEKSKFGLTAAQLVVLVDRLRAEGRLETLKLLHFHLGSQIPDIRFIKAGLQEVARFYVELRNMGVDVTHVDVGGGLGVDYDGTGSSQSHASVNYSLQEYANDVVYTMAEACRENEVPMPHLISESGRALTAHHALLLVKVIDIESQAEPVLPPIGDDDHAILHEMREDYDLLGADPSALRPRQVMEIYHDASFDKGPRAAALQHGRAAAPPARARGAVLLRDHEPRRPARRRRPRRVRGDRAGARRHARRPVLLQLLALPVAARQLGHRPALPDHARPPARRAPPRLGTLQDVTCDSDGKIDRFVGGKQGRPSLELHEYREGEDYILGIFLTGAYQEILGDLHNLFGDTNAVHVKLTERGHEITDLVHGDTVTEVLHYVQFHAPALLSTWRRKVTASKDISRSEANQFIAEYVAGLEGYTYLEGEAAR